LRNTLKAVGNTGLRQQYCNNGERVPATFLQVSDQSRVLKNLIATGTDEIKRAGDQASHDASASVAAELTSAKKDFNDKVTTDSRNAVLKARR